MAANQHIRKTSKAGLAAIVAREGLRRKAYLDSVGVPTIGVGHTAGVRLGQSITVAQALRFLASDVRAVERVVNRLDVPRQRMYDALVSFGFNLGAGIFDSSHTIGKHVHARHWDKAGDSLLLYDVARGHKLLGLLNRRKSERRQFKRGLAAYKVALRAEKRRG